MKRKSHFALFAVLVAATLIMLSGCDPVATWGDETLSIRLETSPRSLTLLPEIDMEIATYKSLGTR